MSMILNRAVVRGRSAAFQSLIGRNPLTDAKISPRLAVDASLASKSALTSLQVANFHQFSKFLSRSPTENTNKIDPDTTASNASSETAPNGLLTTQQALRRLGIVNGKIRRIGGGTTHSTPTSSLRRRPYYRNRKTPHEERRALLHLPQDAMRVRVKSIHAAQTIDVVAVLSKVFGPSSASGPPIRHMFGKSSVIVQLRAVDRQDEEDDGPCRFVAVFRFGSVVFFNMAPQESGKLLEAIKKHGTEPVAAGFERKEYFEVAVYPTPLDESIPAVNGDFCLVESLEMNSVAVVSNIMAQSVALDSYSDIVDELVANFASINSIVTRTGKFTDMEKDSLFRVIAQNNRILLDLTSKLGIKDRSDTAWNLSQYERVHAGLKEEFEIDDRFENIEFKLDMIQQNAKFFLEILHNQKSNTLEWIIIVLIGFECVLMCLDMSGTGTTMFAGATLPFLPK